MKVFTIGHSNHTLDKLVHLLKAHGIQTVVDVRTAPYSRYNPQFNKESLERDLPQHGIAYVYSGKGLGGRPADPTCYRSRALPGEDADYLHEVDYPEVMKRPWFIQAIDQLLEVAAERTTAVMCSEEDPAQCHRHHLIARYLMDQHPEVDVRHIRGDGTAFGARSLRTSVDPSSAEQLSLFGDGV